VETDITYHARHDVLEPACTFRLTVTGLSIDAGGPVQVLPYSEISRVGLRFFPTRVQTNRFECLIDARSRTLKIGNEFYRGIASFDDRSAEYRIFVTELCRRLAAAQPDTEFFAGRAAWALALEYGFLLLMALFLGWILWLTGGTFRFLIWVKLAIVAFFLPTLVRYVKRNRPVRFDPRAIPEDVLPAGLKAGESE
jgi:hypothetical protein